MRAFAEVSPMGEGAPLPNGDSASSQYALSRRDITAGLYMLRRVQLLVRDRLQRPGIIRPERGIFRDICQQALVRAIADQAAAVEHEDALGIAGRGEMMRDQQ